jgi:hypothetical protein
VTSSWAHHVGERLLKDLQLRPNAKVSGWMTSTGTTLEGLTSANVLLLVQGSSGRNRS